MIVSSFQKGRIASYNVVKKIGVHRGVIQAVTIDNLVTKRLERLHKRIYFAQFTCAVSAGLLLQNAWHVLEALFLAM